MSKHLIRKHLTALATSCSLFVGCSVCVVSAAAYDAQAAIAPITGATSSVGVANTLPGDSDDSVGAINAVTTAVSSEGTVRSTTQVDTAAEAAAKAKAEAEAAAKAAAEAKAKAEAAAKAKAEAIRQAALTYTPQYVRTVVYSPSQTASAAVTAQGKLMGKYKLTFYDGGADSNGGWANMTSSGKRATEGRTIAVDPSIIPMGSKVYIEGFGDFIAEDVGGAIKGNRIDIFVNSPSRASSLGVKYANVFVMS